MNTDPKRTIKQLIPIELGWTFKSVWADSCGYHVESKPVTAQALVQYDYEHGSKTEVEFIVVADGFAELDSRTADHCHDNESEYPIGLCPPGASNEPSHYKSEVAALVRKIQKQLKKA